MPTSPDEDIAEGGDEEDFGEFEEVLVDMKVRGGAAGVAKDEFKGRRLAPKEGVRKDGHKNRGGEPRGFKLILPSVEHKRSESEEGGKNYGNGAFKRRFFAGEEVNEHKTRNGKESEAENLAEGGDREK